MRRLYILILTLATAASCTNRKPQANSLEPITSAKLKTLVQTSGRPAVINLWATWCEPCKTEMPELREFAKSEVGQKADLILISADSIADDAKAAEFLKQTGIGAKSYRLDENAESFGKNWAPTWSATLPATFITDTKGTLVTFWVGETSQKDLKEKLAKALAVPAAGPALQRHAK